MILSSRTTVRGIFVSGAWQLTAVGRRLAGTSRTAMWRFSRLGCRDGATLLEPMESKRQSAIATAARMSAFSQRISHTGLADRVPNEQIATAWFKLVVWDGGPPRR